MMLWSSPPQLYSLRGDVFRDPREWIAGLKLTRDLNKKEYAWAAKLADQLYLIDNQDMDARQQPPLSEFLQARFRASRFVHCVLVPAQGVQYEIRVPGCVP